jgi:hypothetical protein
MKIKKLGLTVLPDRYCICRFEPDISVPDWVYKSSFFSVTRTPDELSVVCAEALVPGDKSSNKGWKCLKVQGPLDLSETGILSSLALPLARAGVSIFAISTNDTDYLLVKEDSLIKAIESLDSEGYRVAYEYKEGND